MLETSEANLKGGLETTAGKQTYLGWAHSHRSNILLYVLAIVLVFLAWQLGTIPALLLMSEHPSERLLQLPLSFIIPTLVLLLLVRLLLGRPMWTVALPSWPPRWRDYVFGIGIGWSIMLLLLVLLLLFMPGFSLTYRGTGLLLAAGLPTLLMLALGFVIQTGFEELYFRGLIMQATRRVTRYVLIVLVVQAYLFAQLHTANLTVAGDVLFKMAPYFFAALYLGWAAWRTGSLLLPMGLHFANNSWGAFFVGSQGDSVTSAMPALFLGPPGSLNLFVGYSIAQTILVIAVVEVMVRRRMASSNHESSARGQE